MKSYILFILFILAGVLASPQVLYYQDTFKGGVTGSGYSPEFDTGGVGTITITYSGTNRRCFLLAGREGPAPNITVTLDGNNLTFSAANQVSPTFQSPTYGGNSGVHAIDVTSIVFSGANTLVVPFQPGPQFRYNDFYIYVAYNDAFAATITASIFLNTHNFATFSESYSFPSVPTSVAGAPVSYAEFGGYNCTRDPDGEQITINATILGHFGGIDVGSGICGCCKASFNHINGVLSGQNNNNPNQSMGVSNPVDALSDIKAIISGTSFTTAYAPISAGNTTNAHWASFITYSTTDTVPTPTCDTTASRSVTNITCSSATLNWSAVSGATNYTISYRVVGNIPFITFTTSSTSLILTFLTNTTQYEWKVQSHCDGADNETLLIKFTTAALSCSCQN